MIAFLMNLDYDWLRVCHMPWSYFILLTVFWQSTITTQEFKGNQTRPSLQTRVWSVLQHLCSTNFWGNFFLYHWLVCDTQRTWIDNNSYYNATRMTMTAKNMDPSEALSCSNVTWSLSSKFAWNPEKCRFVTNQTINGAQPFMGHKMHPMSGVIFIFRDRIAVKTLKMHKEFVVYKYQIH